MCSLRHEDRTHPYKSGWRKSETRKKWFGIAAETACVHSASKGNDTDTVSKEGHPVGHKSQTFSISFIRLCWLFLQEVQQLSENFEALFIYVAFQLFMAVDLKSDGTKHSRAGLSLPRRDLPLGRLLVPVGALCWAGNRHITVWMSRCEHSLCLGTDRAGGEPSGKEQTFAVGLFPLPDL